jgi:hypothetical protein
MCSVYGWSACEGFFARKARRCKISGRVEKNANPQLIRLNSGPATKGCLVMFSPAQLATWPRHSCRCHLNGPEVFRPTVLFARASPEIQLQAWQAN